MLRLLLWVALAVAAVVGADRALRTPGVLVTDLMRVVPALTHDPAVAIAVERAQTIALRQLDVLIGGADAGAVRAAANDAERALRASDGLRPNETALRPELETLLADHRHALLAEDDRTRLVAGGASGLLDEVTAALASPTGGGPLSLGEDPAGHFARWAATLPRALPEWYRGPHGLPERRVGGRTWVALRHELTASPFDEPAQRAAATALGAASAAVAARCADCEMRATGVVRFAIAARSSAQREIAVLSLASTLAITALVLALFRSLVPLAVTLATLLTASAAATLAVVSVFGQVHVLTLVFGTTLLGVAVDYATHYLVQHASAPADRTHVFRHILAPVTLGMLTSVIAYALLAFAGLPALQQVAVYSCTGLLAVFVTMAVAFPVALSRWSPGPPRAKWLAPAIGPIPAGARTRRIALALALLGVGIAAIGLEADDDPRQLQSPPAALRAEDAAVRALLGGPAVLPGFVLVEGADPEALARAEERVAAAASAAGGAALAVTRVVPSQETQLANLAAWSSALRDPRALDAGFVALGFRAGTGRTLVDDFERQRRTLLAVEDVLPLAHPMLASLRFTHDGANYGIVQLIGVPTEAVAEIATAVAGARWIAPLDEFAVAFAGVRERAVGLALLATLAIGAMLALRYGLRGATTVLLPPLLALGMTLGVLTLLQLPINVFVLVGLVLVLGIGADQALFARESSEPAARLAMLLAALTTCASFGFLAFSSIPALRGFAVTVFVGVAIAHLLAPLAAADDR